MSGKTFIDFPTNFNKPKATIIYLGTKLFMKVLNN